MADPKKAQGRFMVLLALEHGPKHGYEVARYLQEATDGYFSLSFGALYPVLHKLEQEKLVSATWQDAGTTRKKKVYALTTRGSAALRKERAEYEAFFAALTRLITRSA